VLEISRNDRGVGSDSVSDVPHNHTPSSRERIISAARAEVEGKGILGLRVQDVAQQAKVSVPLIYKYYIDRDGLLAEVLGEMFEEFVLEQLDASEAYINALEQPTIDDVMAILALPQQDFRRPRRWTRMQILAASMEIPALRERLGLVQAVIQERMTAFLDDIQRRMTGGRIPVDSSALAMLVQSYSFGFVLNDLLVESGQGIKDDDFAALMRAFLQAAILGNQVTPVE
jgi:AcrR family transcriptional regulator